MGLNFITIDNLALTLFKELKKKKGRFMSGMTEKDRMHFLDRYRHLIHEQGYTTEKEIKSYAHQLFDNPQIILDEKTHQKKKAYVPPERIKISERYRIPPPECDKYFERRKKNHSIR